MPLPAETSVPLTVAVSISAQLIPLAVAAVRALATWLPTAASRGTE